MILNFLKAAVPLSKTIVFDKATGRYKTAHYPMVRRVSSETENPQNLDEFEKALRVHAAEAHALLTGQLRRQLHDESRAGMIEKGTMHDWVCFDFDKVDYPVSLEGAVDAMADLLPDECQDVEAIIQLSPSSFAPNTTKLSFHAFMLLEHPISTRDLKNWLLNINFDNDKLREQLKLTDSAAALHYKLDPCVADAARLIYIAPPRLKGFKNDEFQWFDRLEGRKQRLLIEGVREFPRSRIDAEVNRLRADAGFDERKHNYITKHGHDTLSGIEEVLITDMQASGNHYLRFNLNGGDSLAYYIDLHHPDVIGNFKGEPFLLTKEAAPELYKQLVKSTKSMPAESKANDLLDILAFYATNHGSKLYVGTYNRGDDVMRVDPSNETAATAFLKQYGIPLRSTLPHHDLVYDIASDHRYDPDNLVINLYQRTDFMKQLHGVEQANSLPATMDELDRRCPVIMKFLRSITGDQRSAELFVNWLAFIFRYRVKTGTAWVLWGTEGSGKGKFLEHVCKPLFGDTNVTQVMFANVDQNFNSLLEGKLLVNIDEASLSKTRDKVETMAKLRNWITEPEMVINTKNVTERSVPSFANFIISSNDFRPIALNQGDRRYHVASRQETRLVPTANEFAVLVQGEELPAFARALMELKIDEHLVRNPESTPQKSRLFEATHGLVDTTAMAILRGDAKYFFEARPSAAAAAAYDALAPLRQYDDLLRGMINNTFNVAKHEDLFVLFSVVVNDPKFFPNNMMMQKQLFGRFGLTPGDEEMHVDKRTGESVHGIEVGPWKKVPKHMVAMLPELIKTDNVLPMKRG